MNVLRTKRAAAFGMAGALALGTVVSAGVMSPADAAGSTYTCTLTSGPVPLAVTGTLAMPASVPSGGSMAGWASTMGVTLPAPVVASLGSLGISSVGGTAEGVAFPIGTGAKSIPLGKITIPDTKPAGDGTLTLAGATKSAASRAPLPGDYKVMMPSEFSFVPLANINGTMSPLGAVPCTTDAPATLGTMHVVKATSKTTAKLAAASRTSRATKVIAKVRAAGYAAKGTVIAKLGKKTVDSAKLRSGKATLNLGKLKAGKHTVKVFYKATKANKASSTSLAFRTKR